MQAVLKKQIVIILSEEEAAWLMCNMQNPLHGQVTEDEDSYDKDMRKVLYSELKKLISGT